jgi:immune inhibitor A
MKREKNIIVIIILVLFIVVPYVIASPVFPGPYDITQPDGSVFQAIHIGDESVSFYRTLDGFTIDQDDDGWWKYVNETDKVFSDKDSVRLGHLEISDVKVGKSNPKTHNIKKELVPKPKKGFKRKNIMSIQVNPQFDGGGGSADADKYFDPVNGTQNILVLKVQFTDKDGTNTDQYFDNLLFNESDSAESVHNYFDEVSYGKIEVKGRIQSEWYNSTKTLAYYGADVGPNDNDSSTKDDGNVETYELIKEVIDLADDDMTLDFSDFDSDDDGVVDHLIVIHAGKSQSTSLNRNTINPHRWSIDACGKGPNCGYQTNDGVEIETFILISERSPMGTFAHELGHDLYGDNNVGLPDLYDTDKSNGDSAGIGYWGLMGSGGHRDPPVHLSAWSKVMKGWVDPIVVTSTGYFNIEQMATLSGGDSGIYELDWNNDEYFLVENRQKVGYDSDLPGNGLLIWHIDNSISNNGDENHKMVDLEEADKCTGGSMYRSGTGFVPVNSSGNFQIFYDGSTGSSLTQVFFNIKGYVE